MATPTRDCIRGFLKLAVSVLIAIPFSFAGLDAQAIPSGVQKIDPCSLLTKAEIQEALGKPVQDGKLNTKANPAVGQPCEFVVGDFGVFSILVKPAGPGETAESVLAAMKRMKMKTADAPGLGDGSFYAFPGYGMVQLNTFKGSHYVVMTLLVPGLSEDAHKAPAEKLMRKALARL
jgi:hypothetical protein